MWSWEDDPLVSYLIHLLMEAHFPIFLDFGVLEYGVYDG